MLEIAQAVARHAKLPFLKIDPLDLDLDVVTSALPAPFARKHTMCAISKHQNGITVAIANPFNVAPLRDLQQFAGLEVKLVVATRRDIEMVNKGFYDLKTVSPGRRESSSAKAGSPPSTLPTKNSSPARRTRWIPPCSRSSPHWITLLDSRVRATRLRHTPGAQAEHRTGAFADRRRAPRRARHSQDRLSSGGESYQDAQWARHRRETASTGWTNQEGSGRAKR